MTPTLAPRCARCRGRHLVDLPCWAGRYARRTVATVLEAYGTACCHCGLVGATSAEHVRPRSHGGTDALANLRPAHLVCNQRRGTGPMAGYGTAALVPIVSDRW